MFDFRSPASLFLLLSLQEYILPPVTKIRRRVEKLTGITYAFLRHGGRDPVSGQERGRARGFPQVFLDFQAFCHARAKGRRVLVAHYAQFDVRMLEGELRRWRRSQHAATAPALGDLFSHSLDSIRVFKEAKWWGSRAERTAPLPRPTSFKLSRIFSHVFNESIANAHNAVGDVRALERLLLSKRFDGWEITSKRYLSPIPVCERMSNRTA